MSEAEIKEEDIQQQIKEDMQQGLTDRDMDFTPREMIRGRKQAIYGLDIIFNQKDRGSWQEPNQDQSYQNFNHII